jgi:hypothetical protein
MDQLPLNPRKEVAFEFYSKVINLGEMALDNYLAEVRLGARTLDFREVNEMKANLDVCRKERDKYK